MNLWNLFPESILNIDYINYLPYAAVAAYIYVFYALIVYRDHRVKLSLFLLITLIASSTMLLTIGPNIGTIVPPLLLLLVVFFPIPVLSNIVFNQNTKGSCGIWLKVLMAAVLHSLSWVVWLNYH